MNPRMMSSLAQLFGGMFGNSGSPYSSASSQYMNFANQGTAAQNPFLQAGTDAIPDYQNWLKSMQDPTAFINNTMGQYQESPWAQYEQKQSINSANNLGSANGMTGSTPMQLQAQQNASNISSQDMNQWLQNVLGINTQYGQGEANLVHTGQESANELTRMYEQMARQMSGMAYGQKAGQNQDFMNMLGGGLSFLFG